MLDREIVLIGYSGHGFVVADAALSEGLNLKHYAEVREFKNNPYKLTYLGSDDETHFKGWQGNYAFVLGVGDNKIREKLGNRVLTNKKEVLNVVHPSASIAEGIMMGNGNFIARNVSVNPLVSIANFCILNTGSIIEHECVILEAAHIAPGAVLAGNVRIGVRTFIGANSVIKQGVTIGNDVIIGAGSVVLNDVPDNEVWVGNPARKLK